MHVCVDICFVCLVQISPMPRERCESCKHWCNRRFKCESTGEMRCNDCRLHRKNNDNIIHENTSEENLQPIFHPTLTIHSHLSFEKRAAIVAFHRIGMKKTHIMKYIACSMPTVNHWIKHYNQHFNVKK